MVFSAASSNAETLSLSSGRDQFRSGYWTRGEVISHFIGTEGQDYFVWVTNRLTPNLMLGLGGIDLSYRFWDKFSLFGAYQLMDVTNRNFRRGDEGIDHLLRLEVTRSFR